MMSVQNGLKIGFYLFLTNILMCNAAARSEIRNSEFLEKLLNVKKQAPVVVFLEQSRNGIKITNALGQDTGDSQQIDDVRDENQLQVDDGNYNNQDVKYVPSAGEEDAYVLYNILRSTQEEEQLDNKAENVIQTTKDILRQAFALRCQARQSCENKCPQKCQTECDSTPKPCPKKKKTCKRENTCKKVCKPKAPACANKCQKKFDELDACDAEPEEEEEEEEEGGCDGGCGRKGGPSVWLRNLLRSRL